MREKHVYFPYGEIMSRLFILLQGHHGVNKVNVL